MNTYLYIQYDHENVSLSTELNRATLTNLCVQYRHVQPVWSISRSWP